MIEMARIKSCRTRMISAVNIKRSRKLTKELKLKTTPSKAKARNKKKSNAEEPVKELEILEVRSETSTKGAKPVKQKLIVIEKNGKLISLA